MRIEHISLGATDLDASATWYRDVLGLRERGGSGDSILFGCGGHEGYDLELRPGRGMHHLAYRADSAYELTHRRDALKAAGLATTEVADGIAVRMPNGTEVRVIERAEPAHYVHATEWAAAAVDSPRELDHVTLAARDVDASVAAATAGLDLAISDIQRVDGKDVGVWMRAGERHHDYAVVKNREDGLHHVAYQLADAAALVTFADRLVRLGGRAEYGIGRHGPGSNLFLYIRDPSGNRVELCCDMAVVPPGAPPRVWEGNDDRFLDVWSPYRPPTSFFEVT
ncbi:MAG: catechol 2,3-dioxygenase [Chloroflexota bacterium]|jgi:catechol 2,3-dioxygenase-like lactoylglutathione lyase family enzyme|nr:catechol 2,3-dioxygenase [Chloroflexota bacterium]